MRAQRDLERAGEDRRATVREVEGEREEVWRCQATEALNATEPLKSYDVRQYWRELERGNVGLLRFLRVRCRGLMVNVAEPDASAGSGFP